VLSELYEAATVKNDLVLVNPLLLDYFHFWCREEREIQKAGKSLFASQSLSSKGSFLFYFGEVVSKMSKTKISMVFGDDLVVDCSRYRCKPYYINHGCEPNCIFKRCK
jgi:hypothetical protein